MATIELMLTTLMYEAFSKVVLASGVWWNFRAMTQCSVRFFEPLCELLKLCQLFESCNTCELCSTLPEWLIYISRTIIKASMDPTSSPVNLFLWDVSIVQSNVNKLYVYPHQDTFFYVVQTADISCKEGIASRWSVDRPRMPLYNWTSKNNPRLKGLNIEYWILNPTYVIASRCLRIFMDSGRG